MNKLLLTILLVAAFGSVKAQTTPEPPQVVEIAEPTPKVDTSERAPSFVGGEKQMIKYFSKNQRTLSNTDTHGRVIASFVIEKDGSVAEAKIIRGLTEEANAEVMRLIKKIPKWNPGIQNNQPVRVQYAMPFTF